MEENSTEIQNAISKASATNNLTNPDMFDWNDYYAKLKNRTLGLRI